MDALTLWPEWAAAIVLLGKRVENRTWHAPRALAGRRMAIHAGASIGGRKGRPAREEAREALLSIPGVTEEQAAACLSYADQWAGHVVATCRVLGSADNAVHGHELEALGQRRWAVPGSIGWLLDDVQILEVPVPAKGRQGLWAWGGA